MKTLENLQSVIARLIGPDGCPWDKEQTAQSLADYIIEESHELVEAIRFGSSKEVCEELGDVAFLLLFIATLYEQKGEFSLDTVLNMNAEKMTRRHPHVFADTTFENLDEQLKAWEAIKRAEKEKTSTTSGIFDSLPKGLPSLIKAYRLHSKAARVNFTWPEDSDVEQQLEAEWLEWLDVSKTDNKEAKSEELGDMLFTLVEIGRRHGIKASEALDYSCQKFLKRFIAMEDLARQRKLDFATLDMDAKDDLWNEVKSKESNI